MSELNQVAARLLRARTSLAAAMYAAETAALEAIEDGMSEAAVARALGVDRMTVRKWVGKR